MPDSQACLLCLSLVVIIVVFALSEPGVVAKSSILLDVKPWDDETSKLNLWGGSGEVGVKGGILYSLFLWYKLITVVVHGKGG